MVREELGNLDRLEVTALASFRVSATDNNPSGDPRFSLVAASAARQRARLLGLEESAPFTAAMATPPVPAEAPLAILVLRDARVLADGRVGIVAVLDALGDEEGPTATLFVLVDAGGRWLLDAAILVAPAEE